MTNGICSSKDLNKKIVSEIVESINGYSQDYHVYGISESAIDAVSSIEIDDVPHLIAIAKKESSTLRAIWIMNRAMQIEKSFRTYIARANIFEQGGILYSQSTDREVYKLLSQEVEIIFIEGMSFDENNSFSKGCNVQVVPQKEFLYVFTDWNMEYLQIPVENEYDNYEIEKDNKDKNIIMIVEENPIEQIYSQLRALTSKAVALKAVELHAKQQGIVFEDDVKLKKAEGVSYLVQNAIDYFDSAATENITQRMLNLYYGTIALMEAEMLVKGEQYKELSEIEKITQNGHGMFTFGDAIDGLNDFNVGVIKQGLFPKWLEHRGLDMSLFPESKKNAQKSEQYFQSLNSLLYCIPELENILLEVDDKFEPGYLFPSYDMFFNESGMMSNKIYYQRKYFGSYVNLIDETKRAKVELIEQLPGKFTLIGSYVDEHSSAVGWKVFVHHKKGTRHYESYKTHKGISVSMLMKPALNISSDWEVYAVMILYTLSIIVRYMPNLWARCLHKDLDYNKSVFYQFSRVAERELTQIFLESISGKKVVIRYPQSLI